MCLQLLENSEVQDDTLAKMNDTFLALTGKVMEIGLEDNLTENETTSLQ